MLHLPIVVIFSSLVLALAHHPRKTNYNEETARTLLQMSAAAYGDLQQVCLNRIHSSPYTVLTPLEGRCDGLFDTCAGYIAASDVDRQLIIVFRGSKTDWQIVFQGLEYFVPIEFYGMGKINSYFADGVDVLWPRIQQVLRNPMYSNYTVTFTGHSLGGALAAVAAARTVAEGLRPGHQLTVYTFGEPRVGNVDFAASFDELIQNSYRVVFGNDIVPHMPPCKKTWIFTGACVPSPIWHHGTEIWYPESMSVGSNYVECVGEPRGEDATCSNKHNLIFYFRHFIEFIFHNHFVYDHRHYFDIEVPAFGKAGCTIG
ncbi:triacylglycerol lipase [Ancylostoma caninum]|uniref:Triacylglycerol lipase n=1 Tax=Ancylostoma caninum TaxID=29170 RepID=A0A368FHR3_ANCCA|nr:triacylglycerol lipase [Ancylostoma caninum]